MNTKFASAVAFSISIVTIAFFAVGAVFLTLVGNTPTYAAPPVVLTSDVMLPLVAVEDNQLKLFGFEEAPQVIDNNVNPFASKLVWSPNGNYLAYLKMSEDGIASLMLTDSLGSTPQVIATDVNSNTFSFSEDSSQLHYTVIPTPEKATSIGDNYTVDVMSHTIGSTSPAMKLASFQQASCGGGAPLPYDALYWIEAGFGGMNPILQVVESGILHSNTCGGMGLSLVKPRNGEATLLDADISRVSVSPDGKTVIGIKNNQLIVVDIATGESTIVETDVTPDQVIWGAEGTGNIYYSIRNTTDEVITYTAEEQQKIFNATGLDIANIAINQVAIHRLNLETGNEEVVYENAAYAIGQMTLLPDNRLLMISEIPSLSAWLENVLDAETNEFVDIETELYLVSLEDGETRLLATGLSSAKLNDEAYVRLFGISPRVTAQPVSVNIGTQIRLTGTNFPLQSRVLAYMGTSATSLDRSPYASGLTSADGSISLSFNLPSQFENGRAISNGDLVFVVETADGLFSAEARTTVNISQPVTRVNTGLPTPAQPVTANITTASISPDNGTVGTQININGRNFPANQRVNVHLGNATVSANNAVYASAFSDANGNISLTFNMPGVYADGTAITTNQVVIVVATDNFSRSAGLVFNFTPVSQPIILPSISVRPTSIKIDERITISGRNFAPSATINILIGPAINDLRATYRTVTADTGGGFEVSFKLPKRWSNGQKVNAKQIAIVANHAHSNASASAIIDLKQSSPDKPNNPGSVDVPPVEETQEPVDDRPADDNEQPSDDNGQPSDDDQQQPSDDNGQPSDDNQQPSDNNGQPSDDDQQPSDNNGQPDDNNNTEEPSSDNGPSDDNNNEPTDDTEITDDTTEEVIPQSVTVSPSSTTVNTGVVISGSGFMSGGSVNIQLVGDGIVAESISAFVNEDGTFTTGYAIPTTATNGQAIEAGAYRIIATLAEQYAETPLTISG